MLVWTTCGGVDDDAATQRCQDFDGLFYKLPVDVGVYFGIWGLLCG